mmetsp:Transcript_35393/g.65027  ORF Transcript_35393/g.65027 Transcript_35393/m.65027 type:complete len:159 (+) Transcript_35393:351-827(+)
MAQPTNLLLREDGVGDEIKVLAATGSDAAPASLPKLLDDAHLLELSKDVAQQATGVTDKVLGGVVPPVGTTVDAGKSTNTKALAKVDLAGYGGSTGVVPVSIVRGELLADTGLDDVNPVRKLDLAGTLEVGGVLLDELGRTAVPKGGANSALRDDFHV